MQLPPGSPASLSRSSSLDGAAARLLCLPYPAMPPPAALARRPSATSAAARHC